MDEYILYSGYKYLFFVDKKNKILNTSQFVLCVEYKSTISPII